MEVYAEYENAVAAKEAIYRKLKEIVKAQIEEKLRVIADLGGSAVLESGSAISMSSGYIFASVIIRPGTGLGSDIDAAIVDAVNVKP